MSSFKELLILGRSEDRMRTILKGKFEWNYSYRQLRNRHVALSKIVSTKTDQSYLLTCESYFLFLRRKRTQTFFLIILEQRFLDWRHKMKAWSDFPYRWEDRKAACKLDYKDLIQDIFTSGRFVDQWMEFSCVWDVFGSHSSSIEIATAHNSKLTRIRAVMNQGKINNVTHICNAFCIFGRVIPQRGINGNYW